MTLTRHPGYGAETLRGNNAKNFPQKRISVLASKPIGVYVFQLPQALSATPNGRLIKPCSMQSSICRAAEKEDR